MSIEAISDDNQERYPSVRDIFRRAHERKLAKASIDTLTAPEVHDAPEYLTHSMMLVHAHRMYEQGLLESTEKKNLRDTWNILERYYYWHHLEQITPVSTEMTAETGMRWAASGLTTVDERTEHLGAIPTDVLRESITSGAIKALFQPGGEYMLHSMAKFLETLTGLPTELGDYDRTVIDNEILALARRHIVLKDMVSEAAGRPYRGKYYGGPYKHLFAPVLDDVNAMIKRIHPELTVDAMHSDDYRDDQTKRIMKAVKEHDKMKIAGIAQWRYDQCIEIMISTWHDDQQQTIPIGLYDRPRATKYGDYRGCAAAAFRMVHQGITGYFVGEEELRRLLQRQHSHQFVSDEEYLKLFETDAFKQEYGRHVQSLQFMGMNLETLRTIAERKRAQHDNIDMFVVANLATESSRGNSSDLATRIQHRVVLYGADKEYAYVLDPNHPFRERMDKREFLKRWAITQNSGYLVVAK
jgi:hypothetical protein